MLWNIQRSKTGLIIFMHRKKISVMARHLIFPVLVLTDKNIGRVRQITENDSHSSYDDTMAEIFLSLMVQ